MNTKTLNIRDLQIESRESDGKGPAVFLLHGNSSSAATFAGLIAGPLGKKYKLMSLSMPGHGASSRARNPDAIYPVPELAQIFREVIAQVGLNRYALVGHSLGGHTFTNALPSLSGARGLMLISAPPLSLPNLGRAFAPDPVGGSLFKPELTDGEVDTLAKTLLGNAARDEVIGAQLRADIRRTDPSFRPALGKSIMTGRLEDETAILASTRVPTALIYGTGDLFLQREYQDRAVLGAKLGRGHYAIDGAGHSPHLERPQVVEPLLEELLAQAFGARS